MTEDRPRGAFTDAEVDRPNAARMYDYYLGGSSNFAVDRAAAERLLAKIPDARAGARHNRAFLGRAVRYCRSEGIRQFLDLGSGIPTVGNVHEIAQADDPQANVVYVDHELVAVAHGTRLLSGNPHAEVIHADLRDSTAVLGSPVVRELIDFSEPVAVLAVAVLHFLPGSQPAETIAAYRRACTGGGLLVTSHATVDRLDAHYEDLVAAYRDTATPVYMRSEQEFRDVLGDLELVEPGLAWAPRWHADRPTDEPEQSGFYAAVARIPRAR